MSLLDILLDSLSNMEWLGQNLLLSLLYLVNYNEVVLEAIKALSKDYPQAAAELEEFLELLPMQVSELEERSPASMLGLEKDDVIIGVNRTRIQSVSDLRDALEEAKGVMALNVVRGNSSLYILIR